MCGIAGFFAAHGRGVTSEQAESVVRTMIVALARRGPDGTGFYRSDGVALGHARLSIIDLEGGDQPLYNEDRSLALVVNGEIYGYQKIRKQLLPNHTFTTHSDSEVMLHLWEEKGASVVEELNGMYSYAIHTQESDELEVGIDPVGVKPLYWYADSEGFFFASEMRAMVAGLKAASRPVHVDSQAIHSYLMQGWTPTTQTGIRGVHKLQPGEVIRIDRRLRMTHRRFQSCLQPAPESSSIESVEHELKEAIRRQLVADVPVGVFLSGGIDSSLVTAFSSEYVESLKTYTVRFEGGAEAGRVNEADVAQRVADHFGCDHHEMTVTEEKLLSLLDTALEAQDDLIADPAVLPLLELSRLASRSVKVCLSGDGGDELFGGYLRHRLLSARSTLNASPQLVRSLLSQIRNRLPESSHNRMTNQMRRARLLLNALLDPAYVSGPFGGEGSKYLLDHGGTVFTQGPASVQDVIAAEVQGPLSNHMLVKTDRISMWHGLEVRVPLLDHEVIRSAVATPWTQKVGPKSGKKILREIASRHIPADIASMPKRGFRVPISDWFRHGLHAEVKTRLLDDPGDLEEFISTADLQTILAEHQNNTRDHSLRIWSLLVLKSWMGRYCAG